MDKVNELQNVEAAQTTSSQIGSGSCLSKKTKLFHSNLIGSYGSTGIVSGA